MADIRDIETSRLLPVVIYDQTLMSRRFCLKGHVQGVGFRPFVFRLASHYRIHGWVKNTLGEVEILAQGSPQTLRQFRLELISKAPPLAQPALVADERIDADLLPDFRIARSDAHHSANIFVPPDYFMCADCFEELNDPDNRRYRYPFINCTQCGPRYTLIKSMPYDRANTSMAEFPLCADCQHEYDDPLDRRFHAEPLACPVCGPSLELRFAGATVAEQTDLALSRTIQLLKQGKIVAVKGIGGYHLMCDASNTIAVARLRERKQRPEKPLAVMFPVTQKDPLGVVKTEVRISPEEEEALTGPSRPIVLLTKKAGYSLADNLAPGLSELGVFLPYSPLHQLLLNDFAGPLVATSGNISGEPVLVDNRDAESRLAAIADAFLHHNRRIVRPADDPVVRRIGNTVTAIRMGRGSAPTELYLPRGLKTATLAFGGQMKNTIALGWNKRAVVSPHIGEMDRPRSIETLQLVNRDLQKLYGVRIKQVACDAHPDYATTRLARSMNLPLQQVWHHHAHASAVAAEHELISDWVMFTWDGVGLGEDGTLWGGECLVGQPGHWQRICSMRPFHPPGGDKVGRAPWRSAAAMMWGSQLQWHDCPDVTGLAYHAWQRHVNSPTTSAVGRLFDGAAALICNIHKCSYEAQAPILLEALATTRGAAIALPLEKDEAGIWRSDWRPLVQHIARKSIPAEQLAADFHATLALVILHQSRVVRDMTGINNVGLAGGVFQNRRLTELVRENLQANGFAVNWAESLPCNDAALSFGQLVEVAARGEVH